MKPDFRVVAQTSIYGNGRGVQGMSSKSSSGKLESRVGFTGWLDDQGSGLVDISVACLVAESFVSLVSKDAVSLG